MAKHDAQGDRAYSMPISDTTNWFASFEYSQKPTTNFFVLGVQPRGKICKKAVPEWREGSNTCNRRKQNISLRNLQLQGPGTAKGRCVIHKSCNFGTSHQCIQGVKRCHWIRRILFFFMVGSCYRALKQHWSWIIIFGKARAKIFR